MKTGFSLWELAHREFPVSYTGFGFAVQLKVPQNDFYVFKAQKKSYKFAVSKSDLVEPNLNEA